MRIISFMEARTGLKSVPDQVVNDADCTIITHRDSEDAIVMPLDFYNSLLETLYLLKSPANAEHLRTSVEQYLTGFWSRRINDKHRLIYAVTQDHITVIASRYHYK